MTARRVVLVAGITLAFVAGAHHAAAQTTRDASACAALTKLQIPGLALTVTALDSFDLLSAMVDWVEKGVAPASVTATGRAFAGRSRPLCAYPQHARYKGQGDPQDARNFECRN